MRKYKYCKSLSSGIQLNKSTKIVAFLNNNIVRK